MKKIKLLVLVLLVAITPMSNSFASTAKTMNDLPMVIKTLHQADKFDTLLVIQTDDTYYIFSPKDKTFLGEQSKNEPSGLDICMELIGFIATIVLIMLFLSWLIDLF